MPSGANCPEIAGPAEKIKRNTENSELFSKIPLLFSEYGGIIQVIYCRLYKRLGNAPQSFLLERKIFMKITEQVWQFAEPVVQEKGCSLWDVEYVREGGEWFLRLYIDKVGGVDINDCEAISRAVDPILDEKDPIPDSYHFEVCSAGLERALKRPGDFEQFMGSAVLVKLYQPRNGSKELKGTLTGYENGNVTIDQAGTSVTLEKKEVALVRLYVEF